MPRKPTDEWAVLAVPVERLNKRVDEKNMSVRGLAELCGHRSHSHIWRLLHGDIRTTSVHTASVIEAVLDARGLLFAVTRAKSSDRADQRAVA